MLDVISILTGKAKILWKHLLEFLCKQHHYASSLPSRGKKTLLNSKSYKYSVQFDVGSNLKEKHLNIFLSSTPS